MQVKGQSGGGSYMKFNSHVSRIKANHLVGRCRSWLGSVKDGFRSTVSTLVRLHNEEQYYKIIKKIMIILLYWDFIYLYIEGINLF